MNARAAERIASLALAPHPEGGYYRQLHRSPHLVKPDDDRDARAALTAIYFLLPRGDCSRWHRVRSDEVWTWIEGEPLTLWQFDGARATSTTLGPLDAGATPLAIVPANVWQAAEPNGEYALVACFVGPGFDFADFTIGTPPNVPDALKRFNAV